MTSIAVLDIIKDIGFELFIFIFLAVLTYVFNNYVGQIRRNLDSLSVRLFPNAFKDRRWMDQIKKRISIHLMPDSIDLKISNVISIRKLLSGGIYLKLQNETLGVSEIYAKKKKGKYYIEEYENGDLGIPKSVSLAKLNNTGNHYRLESVACISEGDEIGYSISIYTYMQTAELDYYLAHDPFVKSVIKSLSQIK